MKVIVDAIEKWEEVALSNVPLSTPLASAVAAALREAGLLVEEPAGRNGDPLNCPACGYDPMAPHNGKGACPPARQHANEVDGVQVRRQDDGYFGALDQRIERTTRTKPGES